MSVEITSPVDQSTFKLGQTVPFKGTANSGVVRVELFAEEFELCEVNIVNGIWSGFSPFNRAGIRQIIAKGFDAANQLVTNDEISITLMESTPDTTSELGIDVSNINPPVNWQAVRSVQITYGFTKATEGATFIDKTFTINWEGMKQAGIIRGAYHFFRPTTSSPQEQADNFLKVVRDVMEPGDLPPVLDVEAWPETVGQQWKTINLEERIERVQIWLEKVELATKRRPIIYTSPSFWKEYMGDTQNFTQYPLWIAHYTNKKEPLVPANNWGGNGYTFWQYTEKGTVPGVIGNVDRNRFKGSKEQLVALVRDSVVA